MKNPWLRLRLAWLLLLFVGAGPAAHAAVELWVAPDGSDANPGTRDRPLATLVSAQRKARELRRLNDASVKDGVRLVLRGGTYALAEPALVRWEDSGTAESPTIVESAPGERALLSGGVRVTGWQRFAAADSRLPEAARSKVWVAEAPEFGGRALEFRQLWVKGGKAVRAQHPNVGAMHRLTGWDRPRQEAAIPTAALGPVRDPAGVEMLLMQQWEIAILRLRSIAVAGETAKLAFQQPESRVEFEHPWPQPILPPRGGGAFCLVNALEFLDAPGEWFQERQGGRVYYWPREGEDLARDEVYAPALENVLRIEGSRDLPVAHVQFRSLGFAHGAWTRPAHAGHVPLQAGMHLLEAYKIDPPGTPDKRGLENQAWIGRMPAGVTVANARHVRFERCRFEQFAATALDFVTGARDSVVEGCVFRDIGGSGMQLGSFQEGGVETHVPYQPSDAREVCERVRIANNFLTDIANEDWGCIGLSIGYAREIAIEHNELSHMSYTGISVGWGWTRTGTIMRDNRIRANLIHHIATRMCDTAGVYTLSAQPGTVVSENVVHSIAISPYVDRLDHWFYYYTDEGSSFITVRDNWCPEEKFLKNANGPGNVWENNGPMVSAAIKDAAGLEPAFRDIKAAR